MPTGTTVVGLLGTARPRRHFPLRSLAVVTALLSVAVGLSHAAPAAAASPLALGVRATFDTRLGGNWAQTGTWEPFSSPAVGDVTGDRVPELVSATVDGSVTARSLPGGAVRWRTDLGRVAVHSSPVLADVGGDGKADVVVGGLDGKVYWLDGPTGRVVRTFAEMWPLYCPAGVDCRPHGFFATPAVVDIDGDGRPEIVAPSWDHTVYAWKPDGRLVFRTYLEDTLWSSPTVADIDGNGTQEIILGGDIWQGNPFGFPPGGLVWVLQADGRPYPGYPRFVSGQVIWSSPAVVDLDGDGALDIVVGTGTHDPFGDGPAVRKIYALTARTGRPLAGWPVQLEGRAVSSPAIGDLDGDGRRDVAITSEGGWVYAFGPDGRPLWRVCGLADEPCGTKATHGSVVIADLDADGRQEAIAALDADLRVLDGATGELRASDRFPDRTYWPAAAPTVADIGGQATVVTQTIHAPTEHTGPAGAGDVVRLRLLSTGKPLCRADWPAFKRSARRNATIPAGPDAVTPFGCARPFLAQQYRDFLGRSIDANGLAYWSARLDQGWSGPRVIQALMDSNEFGRVRAPLVRLTVGLTGGPPTDAARFASIVARYRSGTPLATIAGGLVVDPAVVDVQGRPVRAKSDRALIDDTYRFAVGRLPTAAERSAAVSSIGRADRGSWVASLVSTRSAQAYLRAPVYVSMSYLGMLDRVPEPAGYAFWVPRVRRGISIRGLIVSFQTSSEYRNRVL